MKQCNGCGEFFHGKSKTCTSCIVDIYERYKAGETSRSIAGDYEMTRNQVIGLMHRQKPEGFRHLGAGNKGGRRSPAPISTREKQVVAQGLKNGLTISQMSKQLDYGNYSSRVLNLAAKILEGIKNKVKNKVPENRACQYPFGDPQDIDFHFCGQRKQMGSSYCVVHHAVCHQQDSQLNKSRPKGTFRPASRPSIHTIRWR